MEQAQRMDWMAAIGSVSATSMAVGDISPKVATDELLSATAAVVSSKKGGNKRIVEAMHGKKKTGHGTYVCPFCGAEYKHSKQRDRCGRSPICKMLNQPGNGRLRKWTQQAYVLDLGWRLGTAIVRECELPDNDLTEMDGACGQALADACEHGFRGIREYSLNETAVAVCLDRIKSTAAGVFGVGHPPISCWPLANAVLDLAEEVSAKYEKEFERELANGKEIDNREAWEAVKACLREVIDTVAPFYHEDRDEGPSRETVRKAFHKLIFGVPAKPRSPGAYILDDGIYAAYGREELRLFIHATTGGHIEGHITGINLDEVLEDGRTVGSLLEGRTLPCRVARMG